MLLSWLFCLSPDVKCHDAHSQFQETDTKVRKLLQVGDREAQGRKESGMKGRDEVGKGKQNYVQKGRRAGKMEGDETGVFQLECSGT